VDARLLMYAAGLDDGRAVPQQHSRQPAVAGTATTAGNGDSRQPAGGTPAPVKDAATLSAAAHDVGSCSAAAAEDSSSAQRGGNGQQPPPEEISKEGVAATVSQRQPASTGDATDRVCPHCGHDSTGDGLVMSAVRGLGRVGSQALLSRAGSAHAPPAVEVKIPAKSKLELQGDLLAAHLVFSTMSGKCTISTQALCWACRIISHNLWA
jgi:hypothetical protein